MSRYLVGMVCVVAMALATPQQVEDVDAFVEQTLSELNSGQLDVKPAIELAQQVIETENGLLSIVETGTRTCVFTVSGTVVRSYELIEGILYDLSVSAVIDNAIFQPPCYGGTAEGNLFDSGQIGGEFPCWVDPTGTIMICVFQNGDKVRMVIFCRYDRPGNNPPWIWKKCGDSGWI